MRPCLKSHPCVGSTLSRGCPNSKHKWNCLDHLLKQSSLPGSKSKHNSVTKYYSEAQQPWPNQNQSTQWLCLGSTPGRGCPNSKHKWSCLDHLLKQSGLPSSKSKRNFHNLFLLRPLLEAVFWFGVVVVDTPGGLPCEAWVLVC